MTTPPSVEQQAGRARPGSRLAPLSIGELNTLADRLLRDGLGPVWIHGEVTRFLAHRSGHWYFTLQDGDHSVACAVFRSKNALIKSTPQDGQQVLALAQAGVYPQQGRFQLIVEWIEPRGWGELLLAYEALRKRLEAEGLFASARKQQLPRLPRKIGVVTSLDGAAIRDVLRALRRQVAGLEVLIAHAAVQGETAAEQLVRALRALDRQACDVILIVRGGGAREDLVAFDDEQLVRAAAACRTPIVSGVGHEIDVTLIDLVADQRASTPSAAAELVVQARASWAQALATQRASLRTAISRLIERARTRWVRAARADGLQRVSWVLAQRRMRAAALERQLVDLTSVRLVQLQRRVRAIQERLAPRHPLAQLRSRRERLRAQSARLEQSLTASLSRSRQRLATLAGALQALSPLAVLSRGYSLTTLDTLAGRIIDDAQDVRVGQQIAIRLRRGALCARVESRALDTE